MTLVQADFSHSQSTSHSAFQAKPERLVMSMCLNRSSLRMLAQDQMTNVLVKFVHSLHFRLLLQHLESFAMEP